MKKSVYEKLKSNVEKNQEKIRRLIEFSVGEFYSDYGRLIKEYFYLIYDKRTENFTVDTDVADSESETSLRVKIFLGGLSPVPELEVFDDYDDILESFGLDDEFDGSIWDALSTVPDEKKEQYWKECVRAWDLSPDVEEFFSRVEVFLDTVDVVDDTHYITNKEFNQRTIKMFRLQCNKNTDKDIIEFLSEKPSYTAYLKQLIRADISKNKE